MKHPSRLPDIAGTGTTANLGLAVIPGTPA
jgi:hypothetical protein